MFLHQFSPHHKHELEQTDEEFFLEVNRNNEELIKARNEIAKMNKELDDLRSILNRQNRKEVTGAFFQGCNLFRKNSMRCNAKMKSLRAN